MNINDILNHLQDYWKEIISTGFVSAILVIFWKKIDEFINDIKLFDVLKWIFDKIKDIFTLSRKTKEWRRDYLDEKLDHFRSYTSENEMRLYVPTRFQEVLPNIDEIQEQEVKDKEHKELSNTNEIQERIVNNAAHKELIPYFLKEIWVKGNPDRLYCILAETGMGKTTFLVQLLTAYINKYNEKSLPFEIFILRLADIDVIETIKSLPEPSSDKKSILLLDALDENINAYDRIDENGNIISSYEEFRKELEQAVERFHFVVITCRTQFFTDESAELKKYKYGKEKQSTPDKSLPSYKRLYISPFSKDDIDKFINKKFKHDRNSKKEAKIIIGKIKYLAVRPLILSYIDDLIGGKIENVLDAYEIIIDKWLQREVNHIVEEDEKNKQKELLYDFSRKLAVYIYMKWKKTGVLYLTQKEYEEFKTLNADFNELDFRYTTKSLITRDSFHNIIFAHKSFIEYFCAEQLFLGEISDFNFVEMNMAKTFFELFCQIRDDELIRIGEGDVDKARRYHNIGKVYHDCLGNDYTALEYYKKALKIRKEKLGFDHPDTTALYDIIGAVYQAFGDYDNALEYYKKALKIRKDKLGFDHPDTATSYDNIGGVYNANGEYDKAMEYYKKAAAILGEKPGFDYPDMASLYNDIGNKIILRFEYDKAVKYMKKALAIYEKKLGKTHPLTITTYRNIGYAYNIMGNTEEANKWFKKAGE